jgi:hypothetical protein
LTHDFNFTLGLDANTTTLPLSNGLAEEAIKDIHAERGKIHYANIHYANVA